MRWLEADVSKQRKMEQRREYFNLRWSCLSLASSKEAAILRLGLA